jgi:hypothetical protein
MRGSGVQVTYAAPVKSGFWRFSCSARYLVRASSAGWLDQAVSGRASCAASWSWARWGRLLRKVHERTGVATWFCAGLSPGRTLNATCRDPEMPEAHTVRDWAATKRGGFFPEVCTRANQLAALADEIIDIIDDASRDRIFADGAQWAGGAHEIERSCGRTCSWMPAPALGACIPAAAQDLASRRCAQPAAADRTAIEVMRYGRIGPRRGSSSLEPRVAFQTL